MIAQRDKSVAEPSQRNALEKQQANRRVGLVVCSALFNVLFIGAFFGWGPMQLLLEKNGSFSSLCTSEEQDRGEICPSQSSALLNVQFYAQVSQVTSPFLGQFVDHYGAKALAYLMTACIWAGLVLFVIATKSVDNLLYPAYLLLAQGTWMGAILNLHTGMMYIGHTKSRVIFALNSLFDAGSVTYLGLWGIQTLSGADLTIIIGGYLIVAVLLFGVGCYFWAVAVPLVPKEENDHDPTESDRDDKNIDTIVQMQQSEFLGATDEIEMDQYVRQTTASEAQTTEVRENDSDDGVAVNGQEIAERSRSVENEQRPGKDFVPLASRSSCAQLTSTTFVVVTIFFTIHTTSNQYVLTTIRDFLGYLGDDAVNNKYTLIFSLLMPVSLAALPCTDVILRSFGFYGGFQTINGLSLGFSLIRLLSDNLNVQILGFIIFSFFRCFLFGVTLSFLPAVMAPNVVGKASGIMFAITGLAAFINVPLSAFALEEKNGDFFIPNLVYTMLIIPCILAALILRREVRKELVGVEKEKELKTGLRESFGGVLLGKSCENQTRKSEDS